MARKWTLGMRRIRPKSVQASTRARTFLGDRVIAIHWPCPKCGDTGERHNVVSFYPVGGGAWATAYRCTAGACRQVFEVAIRETDEFEEVDAEGVE